MVFLWVRSLFLVASKNGISSMSQRMLVEVLSRSNHTNTILSAFILNTRKSNQYLSITYPVSLLTLITLTFHNLILSLETQTILSSLNLAIIYPNITFITIYLSIIPGYVWHFDIDVSCQNYLSFNWYLHTYSLPKLTIYCILRIFFLIPYILSNIYLCNLSVYCKSCYHKRLGCYYLLISLCTGLQGTYISIIIRIELDSSGIRIIPTENQNIYNLSVTIHGRVQNTTCKPARNSNRLIVLEYTKS